MWFSRPHPFFSGLVAATVFGLVLGAIVSIGFNADDVETTPARCQDRAVALSVSNKCPKGTYLEVQSDVKGRDFIVCHCEPPMQIILQVPPSQQQDDGDRNWVDPDDLDAPKVDPAPKPITL